MRPNDLPPPRLLDEDGGGGARRFELVVVEESTMAAAFTGLAGALLDFGDAWDLDDWFAVVGAEEARDDRDLFCWVSV
jgi:hypothetical protein